MEGFLWSVQTTPAAASHSNASSGRLPFAVLGRSSLPSSAALLRPPLSPPQRRAAVAASALGGTPGSACLSESSRCIGVRSFTFTIVSRNPSTLFPKTWPRWGSWRSKELRCLSCPGSIVPATDPGLRWQGPHGARSGCRIKDIELEMSRTQKNKATEYHLGQLKAKLAKLRTELQAPTKVCALPPLSVSRPPRRPHEKGHSTPPAARRAEDQAKGLTSRSMAIPGLLSSVMAASASRS